MVNIKWKLCVVGAKYSKRRHKDHRKAVDTFSPSDPWSSFIM